VEDQSQGGAPAAKRGRTTLTVIFARRQDARREEDGPPALAGVGTGVRDGGDRLAADAGERRCVSTAKSRSPLVAS
jgi:hypothetical protein